MALTAPCGKPRVSLHIGNHRLQLLWRTNCPTVDGDKRHQGRSQLSDIRTSLMTTLGAIDIVVNVRTPQDSVLARVS
jgi:hypothetical protein